MKVERFRHRHLRLACDLGPADAATRGEEWRRVKAQQLATEHVPGGVRVWLPAELEDTVRDLARQEALCCGFLDIDVAVHDARVRLEITSPVPAAASLIGFLST